MAALESPRRGGWAAAVLVALVALIVAGLALTILMLVRAQRAHDEALEARTAAVRATTRAREEARVETPLRAGEDAAIEATGEPPLGRQVIDDEDAQAAVERTWSGVLSDADTGAAIEDARVALSLGERSAEAISDTDGRFALAWPAGLEAQLAIEHPRYVDVRAARVDLERDGAFTLLRSGVLRGWIEPPAPPGEAKGIAWLQAASSQRYWERLEAEVDVRGAFELSDLDPGEYVVTARVTGRCVAPEAGLRLERGETLEIVLRSVPGTRVTGMVLEEPRGRAVAGAQLSVVPFGDGLPGDHRREAQVSSETGADGRYALDDLAPGRWWLRVEAPWGSLVTREVDVPGSGEHMQLDVSLPGPARVAGRVVDRAGRGIEGAEVVVFLVEQVDGLLRLVEGREVGACRDVSGPSGSFSLDSVPAGLPLAVAARRPAETSDDELASAPGVLVFQRLDSLDAGQQVGGVELVLAGDLALRGVVLGAEDLPLAGATLEVWIGQGRLRARVGGATADADGRFTIRGLGQDPLRLIAKHDGYLDSSTSTTASGPAGEELVIRLQPAHVVEGLALDAQGLAVAHLPVALEECDSTGQVRPTRSRRRARRATTDAYGRFRLESLSEGHWLASGSSYEWRQVDAEPEIVRTPGDRFVTLTFQPRERPLRSTIEGEVVLAGGGVPSGLRIEGLRGGVLAVDGGRFKASGLVPTRHRLTIRADGHAALRTDAIDLPPGSLHDLGRVELEPATVLTVQVRDEQGRGLNRVRVRLVPLPVADGGAGERAGVLRPRERGRGRYVTSDATRHAWRLVVDREGYRRDARRIEVQARERQTVEVALKPAAEQDG